MQWKLLAAFAVFGVLSFSKITVGQEEEQLAPNDEQTRMADQALKDFFEGKPEAMDQESRKYNSQGERVYPNKRFLGIQGPKPETEPLYSQAQFKKDEKYFLHFCKRILKKLPGNEKLDCEAALRDGKAPINEANDNVEDLVDGWIDSDAIARTLGELPVKGKVKSEPWSDDYWRIQWGVTSFRYATDSEGFKNYKEAVASYAQPLDFTGLGANIAALTEAVSNWSPAEKYDMTVGDEEFTLTNQQKALGSTMLNSKGDVEEWMGICDGWAPAAFMVPTPKKAFTVTGAKGAKVTWYPHDVRAIASLAWANGDTNTNFIGGRCDAKKVKKHKNGRLAQEECFDNNPGTFVLALGNMVGIQKKSFVIDRTFDYEVWNQPVVSYQLEFFNPLKPLEKRGLKWEKFAVPYNAAFKKQDRFQKPNTRVDENGSDKHIKQIVGVRARVVYGAESFPVQDENPGNLTAEFTSQFDLELDAEGKILGGEWYDNLHVDFMWVPQLDEVATSSYDEDAPVYKGKASEILAESAVEASDDGYPLCTVVSYLVGKSSGKKSYVCGE